MKKEWIGAGGRIRYLAVILGTSLICMGGMNIAPVLKQISTAYPAMPIETIQLLVSIPSFFTAAASFCANSIAKRISCKRSLLLGFAVYVLSGMLPIVFRSFSIMLVSRMLIGISIGIVLPLSSNLIFEFFSEESARNTVIGWQSCAQSIGNILATVFAGYLVIFGYKYPFLVHLIGVVSFVLTLVLLPQDQTSPQKARDTAHLDRKKHPISGLLLFLCVFAILHKGYINAYSTKISLLVESYGIGDAAVSAMGISVFTAGSFIGGLMYGQIYRVLKRFTLTTGFLLCFFSLLLMGTGKTPMAIYIASVLMGVGLSISGPVILVFFVNAVSKDNRTFGIALNTSMSQMGLSISPYVTSATAALFVQGAATIRDEYIISAIAIAIMFAGCLIFTLCALLQSGKRMH